MHVNVCMNFNVKETRKSPPPLTWSTSLSLHYTGKLSEENRNQHLLYAGVCENSIKGT